MLKPSNKNVTEERAALYRSYVRTSAVGLEVGISLVGSIFGGYWLGQKVDLNPLCLILGCVVGVTAAIRVLWTFSRAYLKQTGNNQ